MEKQNTNQNSRMIWVDENILISVVKSLRALQLQILQYHTQGSAKAEMTGEKSKGIFSSSMESESQLIPPSAADIQTLIKETKQNRQYRVMMLSLGVPVWHD